MKKNTVVKQDELKQADRTNPETIRATEFVDRK